MAGDLEDFLRRAAQRRQAKAAQNRGGAGRVPGQPGPGQPGPGQLGPGQLGPASGAGGSARPRPEYSNRKTERMVAASDADEVLVAEVVEDEVASIVARKRRLEAAEQAKAAVAKKEAQRNDPNCAYSGEGVVLSGNASQDLIKLLSQPGGIRQAILLREILDRPEHRW